MPLTLADVTNELAVDEPDYDQLAGRFGGEAIPLLADLARTNDPALAPKAVFLAALIHDPQSVAILEEAARNPDPRWKIAAAGAAAELADQDASQILLALLGDADAGVRRMAIEATPAHPNEALRRTLETLRVSDAEQELRALAQRILAELPAAPGN